MHFHHGMPLLHAKPMRAQQLGDRGRFHKLQEGPRCFLSLRGPHDNAGLLNGRIVGNRHLSVSSFALHVWGKRERQGDNTGIRGAGEHERGPVLDGSRLRPRSLGCGGSVRASIASRAPESETRGASPFRIRGWSKMKTGRSSSAARSRITCSPRFTWVESKKCSRMTLGAK